MTAQHALSAVAAPKALASRRSAAHPALAGVDRHVVCLLAPTSQAGEQYRALAQILLVGAIDKPSPALAVTSARPSEGKTTTAVNLACVLAQAPGARVLLVDADLRRPNVGNLLGISDRKRPGLSDWICDTTLGLDAAAPCYPALPNLSVMVSGSASGDAYALLQSERFSALVPAARGYYNFIVVDTPPILPVPDYRLIAPRVDGLLMVVAAHETPRRLVEAAIEAADPEKIVGIVLNGDAGPLAEYRKYYTPYYGARDRRHRTLRG